MWKLIKSIQVSWLERTWLKITKDGAISTEGKAKNRQENLTCMAIRQ